MLNNLIAVFIGGGTGAAVRFLITMLSKRIFLTSVCGTFFINIFGCFLMGYAFAFFLNKIGTYPQTLKFFVTVGFLGGLTTLSTLNVEVFEFFKHGKILFAFLYLFSSCFISLLTVCLGYFLYSFLNNSI